MSDDTANALPPGTRLGEFELRGVLGVGGFGIVYRAWDHDLEREVAVKEYMPTMLAGRSAALQVSLASQADRESFELGLRSFVGEARMLARFDHPGLVKVYRYWEGNGTAYMAMPFYRGRSLHALRNALSQAPDEAWVRRLLGPLLGALERLHAQDIYHRDIAPDNVLVLDEDESPVLLDFGAARRVLSDRSQALTAILKPSFAPIEQYGEAGPVRQGPWTDLYALGATLHFLLRGRPPPPATGRMLHDELLPLKGNAPPGYSDALLGTIDWMLRPRPADRPQNVAAVRDALDGRQPVPELPVVPAAPVPPTVLDIGSAREVAAVQPTVAATSVMPASRPAPAAPTDLILPTQRIEPAAPAIAPTLRVPPPSIKASTPVAAPTSADAHEPIAADRSARAPDPPAAGRQKLLVPLLAAAIGAMAVGGWVALRGRDAAPPAPAAAASTPAAAASAPAMAPASSSPASANEPAASAAAAAASMAAAALPVPAGSSAADAAPPPVASATSAAVKPAGKSAGKAAIADPAPRPGRDAAAERKASAKPEPKSTAKDAAKPEAATADSGPRPAPTLPPPLSESRPSSSGPGNPPPRIPAAPEPDRAAASAPARAAAPAPAPVTPGQAATGAPSVPPAAAAPAPASPAPAAAGATTTGGGAERNAPTLRPGQKSPAERCEGRGAGLAACVAQVCRMVADLRGHPDCEKYR